MHLDRAMFRLAVGSAWPVGKSIAAFPAEGTERQEKEVCTRCE